LEDFPETLGHVLGDTMLWRPAAPHKLPYSGYQPKLGDAVFTLRGNNRELSASTSGKKNFWVLCPSQKVGIGQQRQELSDQEANKTVPLWGPNPVHSTGATCWMMANSLENDLQNVHLVH
jgi:hypothetical protein